MRGLGGVLIWRLDYKGAFVGVCGPLRGSLIEAFFL